MHGGGEKRQVLGDYAALLRAFLPQARAFHRHWLNGATVYRGASRQQSAEHRQR